MVREGARRVLHLVLVQRMCAVSAILSVGGGEFAPCQFGMLAEFSPNADNGFLPTSAPLRGAHVSQCLRLPHLPWERYAGRNFNATPLMQ